jgi:hypothetical protein
MFTGCEIPQPDDPIHPDPLIEGLKITDLKDDSTPVDNETLMRFKVLTYTLIPDLVDRLKEVFDGLSDKEIRVANKAAFSANGFMIGTASFKESGQIAQKLARMGADRTGQGWLVFPPDKTETLTRTPLRGPEAIHYATSASGTGTITPESGFLGWVFSASPDPRFRGMAQVKLFPAIWRPGLENIRLVMGEEAFDYQPIHQGQVLVRVEEGGVILLGPARSVPDETTLDKLLFFLPGRRPKVQFFVIIYDSAGT